MSNKYLKNLQRIYCYLLYCIYYKKISLELGFESGTFLLIQSRRLPNSTAKEFDNICILQRSINNDKRTSLYVYTIIN